MGDADATQAHTHTYIHTHTLALCARRASELEHRRMSLNRTQVEELRKGDSLLAIWNSSSLIFKVKLSSVLICQKWIGAKHPPAGSSTRTLAPTRSFEPDAICQHVLLICKISQPDIKQTARKDCTCGGHASFVSRLPGLDSTRPPSPSSRASESRAVDLIITSAIT